MLLTQLLLLGGGLFAGIINSVAGGGSFILFPLLVSLGLTPIIANATFTLAVMPGSLSSAYGYRYHIRKLPKRYYLLLVPSLLGGLTGAVLLRKSTDATFGKIVPFFVLMAVVLLIFQPLLHKKLFSKQGLAIEHKYRKSVLGTVGLFVFIVAVYGGYFGAGFGIMILAFLGLTALKDIHQMNGLKNLAGMCLGVTAGTYFIVHGLIDWQVLPMLLLGSAIGGYIGAHYGSRLPTKTMRAVIIAIGLCVAILLFNKYY